jgi:hypothetical protein
MSREPSAFEPPSERAWQKLRAKTRRLFPMPFKVKLIRSRVPPSWAEPHWDAGFQVWYTDSTETVVDRVEVWFHARHSRAALVDSIHHEMAHVMQVEHDPQSELNHDDDFWIKHGEIYRAWMREKYGSAEAL